MRAAVLRAYGEDLEIEQVVDPDCPGDGVVLRVLACGVCRSDYHGWVGEHARVKPGQILGHEYCGEVVAVGPLARWQVEVDSTAPSRSKVLTIDHPQDKSPGGFNLAWTNQTAFQNGELSVRLRANSGSLEFPEKTTTWSA